MFQATTSQIAKALESAADALILDPRSCGAAAKAVHAEVCASARGRETPKALFVRINGCKPTRL